MMINLYKDDKIFEDNIDDNKMVGDMQTAEAPQFMSLWYSNLQIQSYAFDLLSSLCLENSIFPGQFGELLIEMAGGNRKECHAKSENQKL
jgi:hypothetical protein